MFGPSQVEATLLDNRSLAPNTFVLRLQGCESLQDTKPGQFVMLSAEDWESEPLLPRAFSLLAKQAPGTVEILIRGTGKAARRLERALVGARFSLLGPLGTPFPVPAAERLDWFVAGGVGLAPLLMQAELARENDVAQSARMFYGGRAKSDLVLTELVTATGVAMDIATEDGSWGHAGYVTGAVSAALDAHSGSAPTLLACGPEPMLEAVARLAHRRGLAAYLSVEGEMACGIGACLGCAIPCRSRPYRYACVDGPVFSLDDLGGVYAAPCADAPGDRV